MSQRPVPTLCTLVLGGVVTTTAGRRASIPSTRASNPSGEQVDEDGWLFGLCVGGLLCNRLLAQIFALAFGRFAAPIVDDRVDDMDVGMQ